MGIHMNDCSYVKMVIISTFDYTELYYMTYNIIVYTPAVVVVHSLDLWQGVKFGSVAECSKLHFDYFCNREKCFNTVLLRYFLCYRGIVYILKRKPKTPKAPICFIHTLT